MRGGDTAEMAIVGSEGVVGFAVLLGGTSTTTRASVQVAGNALRVKRRVLEKHMESDASLRKLMMRYVQSLLTQIAQTAVCNRHHAVTEQLCRWILLGMDRGSSTEISMTQQLIADMLGVRREGVSAVANKLKRAGLIAYSRGRISVLDRPGLEKRVCECYGIVLTETERLLPGSNRRQRLRSS
jgi:CRP-like cAMP-binding protein